MWDLRSNSIVRTLETGKEVTSIEVSADGRTITTADGKQVRRGCTSRRRSLHAAQRARRARRGHQRCMHTPAHVKHLLTVSDCFTPDKRG